MLGVTCNERGRAGGLSTLYAVNLVRTGGACADWSVPVWSGDECCTDHYHEIDAGRLISMQRTGSCGGLSTLCTLLCTVIHVRTVPQVCVPIGQSL